MGEPLDHWLMRLEGLRLKPYNDEKGFCTIGYGHNLAANGIPINIADQLLDIDMAQAKKDVARDLPWVLQLDQPRQDAFYHLCFWLGIGSLLGFVKMLAAAQSGDWQAAASELLDSSIGTGSIFESRTSEIVNRLLKGYES